METYSRGGGRRGLFESGGLNDHLQYVYLKLISLTQRLIDPLTGGGGGGGGEATKFCIPLLTKVYVDNDFLYVTVLSKNYK